MTSIVTIATYLAMLAFSDVAMTISRVLWSRGGGPGRWSEVRKLNMSRGERIL